MGEHRAPWIKLAEGSEGARIINCDIPSDIEIAPGVKDTVISGCRFYNAGVRTSGSSVAVAGSTFAYRQGTAFTLKSGSLTIRIGTGALAVAGDLLSHVPAPPDRRGAQKARKRGQRKRGPSASP